MQFLSDNAAPCHPRLWDAMRQVDEADSPYDGDRLSQAMDEAFSALDPLIRSEMQDQLIDLQKRLHKTIIFITHDLDEAIRLGDRIAILKAGEVVQVDTPANILARPADDYVEAFVRNVNRELLPAGQ